MRSPEWDAAFVASPTHGAVAQRRLVEAVLSYCQRRRTAIDVGAHIGTWAIPLAEQFREVWAFEPVEENFQCLKANTNELRNVCCFKTALGVRSGSCKMYLPTRKNNSGCWYASVDDGDTPICPLDFIADIVTDVDLIKLDVEGFEGAVLRGAALILKRDRPVVFFEQNGLGEDTYGKDWIDPRVVLDDVGYRFANKIEKNELWVPNENVLGVSS